jgi:hypothetical protein
MIFLACKSFSFRLFVALVRELDLRDLRREDVANSIAVAELYRRR